MHESDAFERQIEREVLREAGPEPAIDALAIARSVSTAQPSWRMRPMFDATRVMIATVIAATAGGVLLAGIVQGPDGDAPVPAALAPGSACPEATALDGEAIASAAVPVAGTITFLEEAVDSDAVVDESRGYARISYAVDDVVTDFDDERLSGILSGTVDAHFLEDDAWVVDGEVTILNEQGSWVGTDRGAGTADTDQRYRFDLRGTGEFTGCSAIIDLFGEYQAAGVIYPTGVLPTE